MSTNVLITKLPYTSAPWAWGLRVVSVDGPVFPCLIQDIKQGIPARRRKWSPGTKQWLFHAEVQLDLVLALVTRLKLTYAFDDDQKQAHRQMPMSRTAAAATLYLLPSAPPYVVDAVYRAIAKQHHPDRGGSTEQMQMINAAVELLR